MWLCLNAGHSLCFQNQLYLTKYWHRPAMQRDCFWALKDSNKRGKLILASSFWKVWLNSNLPSVWRAVKPLVSLRKQNEATSPVRDHVPMTLPVSLNFCGSHRLKWGATNPAGSLGCIATNEPFSPRKRRCGSLCACHRGWGSFHNRESTLLLF